MATTAEQLTTFRRDLETMRRRISVLIATFNETIEAAESGASANDIEVAIDAHKDLETDVHGAVTGVSKIAKVVTPAGTACNIYVDEESSPSTPANLGDIRIIVPDGFF